MGRGHRALAEYVGPACQHGNNSHVLLHTAVFCTQKFPLLGLREYFTSDKQTGATLAGRHTYRGSLQAIGNELMMGWWPPVLARFQPDSICMFAGATCNVDLDPQLSIWIGQN